ncbi:MULTISPECIES: HAD family hydrolase [unclassified Streptomyces]|uniref:HAD family hydrolase n=1 Tax=unclassified Streptomyces TaxID=2593676 RepID=UPI003809F374
MTPPRRAAFFDVDETLVTQKTLFGFLRFHFAAEDRPASAYEDARAGILGLRDRGVSREVANRAYYALYAGASQDALAEQGNAWFQEQMRAGGFFHPPGLDALRRHRAAGDAAVLVSGSFFACLDPIAEHLGADDVFGTAPVVMDGRLTGEVVRPMIGAAKASVAVAWAAGHGVDPADCFAYGDHASDLQLLRAVGHPVAVGDDPALCAHVTEAGGRILPGVN